MATWRPPKTDYWVTEPVKVVGGSDFQRSEENIKYLKEQTDGIKSGSIKVGKASQADSVTSYVRGSISINYSSNVTITHNLGTTNVFAVAVTSDGDVGGCSSVNANQIRIRAHHDGHPTEDVYKTYRYFIAK